MLPDNIQALYILPLFSNEKKIFSFLVHIATVRHQHNHSNPTNHNLKNFNGCILFCASFSAYTILWSFDYTRNLKIKNSTEKRRIHQPLPFPFHVSRIRIFVIIHPKSFFGTTQYNLTIRFNNFFLSDMDFSFFF